MTLSFKTYHCISHALLAEVLVVVKVIFVAVGFDQRHKLVRALLHTHLKKGQNNKSSRMGRKNMKCSVFG